MTGRTVKRILIVEDELLVALHLEDMLINLGHQVIGPCTRIRDAMESAHAGIDFAILDINLAGTPSFPVADILRQRGIPFAFASGYGAAGLVDRFRSETILRKPYDLHEVRRALAGSPPEYQPSI